MAIVCEKIKSKIIKLKKSERKITIALQTRGNKKKLNSNYRSSPNSVCMIVSLFNTIDHLFMWSEGRSALAWRWRFSSFLFRCLIPCSRLPHSLSPFLSIASPIMPLIYFNRNASHTKHRPHPRQTKS